MKNKKLFFVIYIIFITVIVISIITLSFLGYKERIGYLSDFKINIYSTLQLNGFDVNKIEKLFIIDNKIDESSISNFVFTNISITNYYYDFRIKYYSKVFRNSDIYDVYVDTNKVIQYNDFIKEIKMQRKGSPFGNLVSYKIIDFEKVDNVSYKLSLKDSIAILFIFIYIIYTFILYIRKIVFENKKYKLLFYLLTFVSSISAIYVLQINILYIVDLLIFAAESIFIYKYRKNIFKFLNNIVISNKLVLFIFFIILALLLCLSVFTNINLMIKYIILFIYLNIFFIFLGILSIKKFNLSLNINNLFYISIFIFLFNINMSYTYLNSFNNLTKFMIFFIYSLILSLFFFLFYIYTDCKKIKLEKIFVVSILIIGISYFIFLPPMEVPDEVAHYVRSYEISKGLFTYDKSIDGHHGNYLPIDLYLLGDRTFSYKDLFNKFNIKVSETKTVVENTALHYSPLSYFPQSIGMFLSRIINVPLLLEIYFAKLFALLFFSISIYFSMKYIPIKKNTLYLMCFFPMVIQQTASLSADSVLITSSLSFISFILYLKYKDESVVDIKEVILLFILFLFIAMSKSVYIFLFILMFSIPKEKFKYNKYLVIFSILAVVGIIYFLWSKNISVYISSEDNFNLKKEYILNNPMKYIGVLMNTIKVNGNFYLSSIIGRNLSWFSISINDFIYYSILLLILIFIVFDNDKRIKLDLKIMSFIIIGIVSMLVFTGLYLTWTNISDNVIAGVQGRYFIPIVFLVFLIFNFDYLKLEIDLNNKIILLILSMFHINILNTIFNNYI